MSSTKYPCYGAVHIPGVPGIFSNVIVEIDDVTREVLSITTFDGKPVPDPAQSSTPKEATKTSDTSLTPEAAKAPSDTPRR
jgi:hypothetical protein